MGDCSAESLLMKAEMCTSKRFSVVDHCGPVNVSFALCGNKRRLVPLLCTIVLCCLPTLYYRLTAGIWLAVLEALFSRHPRNPQENAFQFIQLPYPTIFFARLIMPHQQRISLLARSAKGAYYLGAPGIASDRKRVGSFSMVS